MSKQKVLEKLQFAKDKLTIIDNKLNAIERKRDSALRLIDEAIEELEEEEDPPKLVIRDGVLYFGNGGMVPFLGKGVSRREILNRANGDWDSLYGRPLEFFLDLSIEYGLNYERVNSTWNIGLLRRFLQSRHDAGIVVELTLMDRQNGAYFEWMGEPKEIIQQTKDFSDIIIYDPVNELYDMEDVSLAWWYCNHLRDLGLISSAGAYGSDGEGWSQIFDPMISTNKIIGVHRYYGNRDEVRDTIEPYSGKPMIWTESFRLTADEWAERCQWFKDEGVCCFNYYGLRSKGLFPDLDHDDPNPWRQYYEKTKELFQ